MTLIDWVRLGVPQWAYSIFCIPADDVGQAADSSLCGLVTSRCATGQATVGLWSSLGCCLRGGRAVGRLHPMWSVQMTPDRSLCTSLVPLPHSVCPSPPWILLAVSDNCHRTVHRTDWLTDLALACLLLYVYLFWDPSCTASCLHAGLEITHYVSCCLLTCIGDGCWSCSIHSVMCHHHSCSLNIALFFHSCSFFLDLRVPSLIMWYSFLCLCF